ncbi:hypothetical protein YC2023_029893 [Brassica napus]
MYCVYRVQATVQIIDIVPQNGSVPNLNQLKLFASFKGNRLRVITRTAGPSKNRRMPLSVERTRYSLVKGERIVRFVLITWLQRAFIYSTTSAAHYSQVLRCGIFQYERPKWRNLGKWHIPLDDPKCQAYSGKTPLNCFHHHLLPLPLNNFKPPWLKPSLNLAQHHKSKENGHPLRCRRESLLFIKRGVA